MSEGATFHASFDDASVTVKVDYSQFGRRKDIVSLLNFVWDGQPTARTLPQYVTWMHSVLAQIARRTQQKILYVYPAGGGSGHDIYAYLPDGTYTRAPRTRR